ncbi:sensor histidine kinase [Megasphaera paucivorans]|uniref:histidine kinase n=1 Tax=Megasphaera paucivorans TaxID=349095 RepID=A0A1H0AGB8_9FIRM|nr:sensor histidine kinase [Megasphaera paucivorans]SDN32610.1 Signal transduction histidine kinase [Megasphaera paucivorans]
MKNHSLYVKFNVLIVGTIFICGILIASLLLYTTSTEMEHGLDKSGAEIAESISAIISNYILVDNRFAITEQLMHTQSSNQQIRYIIVSHPNGQILASTFTNGIPDGLPVTRMPQAGIPIDTMTFDSNEGYIREVLCPIEDGLVGYFRIGLREKPMMQLMRRRFMEMIMFISLICILASWLATRYARNFLKPIQNISIAVRQLGHGNYHVRVPVETTDDVGRLAQAFNRMTDRLYAKDRENFRLVAALKEKEKMRMWLINQLFSAREDERRRISRELHDETSQSMVSMLAYLRLISDRSTDDESKELVHGVQNLTRETLEGLRHLAVTLHPPLLDDLGLIVAIEKYLDTYRCTQPHIHTSFTAQGDFSQVTHPISLLCYRMLQESLTNIVRHSRADTVSISVTVTDTKLTMFIEDNGIGFSEDTMEKARLDNHLGIVSMRERTSLLNGTFHIHSISDVGTRITIILPVAVKGEEGGLADGETN